MGDSRPAETIWQDIHDRNRAVAQTSPRRNLASEARICLHDSGTASGRRAGTRTDGEQQGLFEVQEPVDVDVMDDADDIADGER
jgi:hypothetical protein